MLYPLSYEGLEFERTVHAGVGPEGRHPSRMNLSAAARRHRKARVVSPIGTGCQRRYGNER